MEGRDRDPAALAADSGVVIFVALFGATSGALVIVRAALILDYFGRRSYGEIAGLIALGATLAWSGGPILAGLLYGLSGSYEIPFRGFAIATALAALLMLVAERQRSTRTRLTEQTEQIQRDVRLAVTERQGWTTAVARQRNA